jgi:hypothetical protein
MDQLVGDAAKQRPHTSEATGADNDLVGAPGVRHAGNRLRRGTADELALPVHVVEAGVGRLCGVEGPRRVVDVRLAAAAAPGLRHLPSMDEIQLAVRPDAPDRTRERDVRGRRAVEADDDDGMVWRGQRAENYVLIRGSRRMEVGQRRRTVTT